MGREFYLKVLGAVVRFNFLNFEDMPCLYVLSDTNIDGEIDLAVYIFKDHQGSIIKRLRKGRVRGSVRKEQGKLYCELFNNEKRKTFCFFEHGLPLDMVIHQAINDSFLVFQSVLGMIFLHSASVVMGDKVYLFIAPSGGGKTTISSLARENGLCVMSDEFCAIKRNRNRFYAGLFPWHVRSFGPDEEWEVGGVYFLNKSDANRISPLSVIEAIRRAMPQATSFFHNHIPRNEKASYRESVFNFLSSMFENIDFKLLDFKKNPDVFPFLKSHDKDKVQI